MFGNEPWRTSRLWTYRAIGLLRIVTALLFLEHGTAKLLGFPETTVPQPAPWSTLWVAGMFELVGGLLLLVGFLTRPIALLLAGEMAVAYWMVHAPQSPFPIVNMGEAAILFCFIFLLLVATGAGRWSIDGILAKGRSHIEGYEAPGGERIYGS